MQRLFFLLLFCGVMLYAQSVHAISIGGSVRGGGFGFGVSSDGSATVRGGTGHVGGSVHVDSNSNNSSSSQSSSNSQNSSASNYNDVKVIFQISPNELPKYKGKTPKVYARLNGALLYSDTIFLGYNRTNKQIEIKVIDPDGSIRHSAMFDKDIRIRVSKGDCQMVGNDFICPQ